MSDATEIRTVAFEDLKRDLERYMQWARDGITVVILDADQEEITVLGPWRPGEERTLAPKWFFDELFPSGPLFPDDPGLGLRALEEVRGYRPFT